MYLRTDTSNYDTILFCSALISLTVNRQSYGGFAFIPCDVLDTGLCPLPAFQDVNGGRSLKSKSPLSDTLKSHRLRTCSIE
jgi:hypothetical protein